MTNKGNSITQVGELMTPSLCNVTVESTIADAWRLLRSLAVSHLPITNDAGGLVGLASDADFARALVFPLASQLRSASGDPLTAPVSSVMSATRIVIEKDDDVEEAFDLMTENQMAVLPVIDSEGRVVGIVSVDDIVTGLVPLVQSRGGAPRRG